MTNIKLTNNADTVGYSDVLYYRNPDLSIDQENWSSNVFINYNFNLLDSEIWRYREGHLAFVFSKGTMTILIPHVG